MDNGIDVQQSYSYVLILLFSSSSYSPAVFRIPAIISERQAVSIVNGNVYAEYLHSASRFASVVGSLANLSITLSVARKTITSGDYIPCT